MVKLCTECGIETINRANNNIRLCNDCSNLDKYNYICKSTIKSDYCLTDKDITTIPYISVKNPHYRCASDMKLYSIADIKTKFMEKHNCVEIDIDDKLTILKQKAQLKKEKLRNNKLAKQNQQLSIFQNLLLQNNLTDQDHNVTKQEILACDSIPNLIGKIIDNKERTKLLKTALKIYNLNIRSDSKLCSNYLNGDNQYTANEIALIMKQMEWFFNNTNYKQILSNLFNNSRHKYEYYERPDPTELSADAKRKALNEYLKTHKKNMLPDYIILLVK